MIKLQNTDSKDKYRSAILGLIQAEIEKNIEIESALPEKTIKEINIEGKGTVARRHTYNRHWSFTRQKTYNNPESHQNSIVKKHKTEGWIDTAEAWRHGRIDSYVYFCLYYATLLTTKVHLQDIADRFFIHKIRQHDAN